MKKHTKIFIDYWNISHQDEYLPCEYCNIRAVVDVHHLMPRGMGGKNAKVDRIENLMGLCRECHNKAEAKQISREELTKKHLQIIGRDSFK